MSGVGIFRGKKYDTFVSTPSQKKTTHRFILTGFQTYILTYIKAFMNTHISKYIHSFSAILFDLEITVDKLGFF